eukprot:CAMPEP_0114168112 /NCGR_PEP_ID=MMETSP0043_2-20121206/32805_1 /TAXON_ID=464988 /ORGANISM="Hemiselmis andersenii, Strain CCMP644" /LENGTH=51 /DNA_ID=CAMNT_0001265373 /DNA_START=42 /DNA_END=193 /DNA_ORIENTATION=+
MTQRRAKWFEMIQGGDVTAISKFIGLQEGRYAKELLKLPDPEGRGSALCLS